MIKSFLKSLIGTVFLRRARFGIALQPRTDKGLRIGRRSENNHTHCKFTSDNEKRVQLPEIGALQKYYDCRMGSEQLFIIDRRVVTKSGIQHVPQLHGIPETGPEVENFHTKPTIDMESVEFLAEQFA